MIRFYKILVSLIILINFTNISLAREDFFNEGVKLFEAKKFDDAKFLFERSVVFEPKHANSYLYLAKIYKVKELSERFIKVCKNLCNENEKILQDLKNLEPKNES